MVSLYLHVPFRRRERPYDEAAYERYSSTRKDRYVAAVQEEIRAHLAPRLIDEPLESIYVGGGCPSLLPLCDLQSIWAALASCFDLSRMKEATLEIEPMDVTPDDLEGLRRLGISRVTVEALSFSTRVLREVDAPHTRTDVEHAVSTVLESDFESVSTDLFFGLTQQSPGEWEASLRAAIAASVPHISLTEHPSDGRSSGTDHADMFVEAVTVLQDAGYEQYGLPHFARPGHRSVHQEHYYAHDPYVGLGPSAESFWWMDSSDLSARRRSNVKTLDGYAAALEQGRPPVAEDRSLEPDDLAEEYIVLQLQTRSGLDLTALHNRYDVSPSRRRSDLIARLIDEELIRDLDEQVQLTPAGRLLTDAITRRFLSTL